ncbi:MAG: RNA-binding protein [Candidatus Magasanikbacteria bacterium]|nr:RNA-binding protein [Candidatus Magasanikbacteria bacterium]
MESKKLYVGNLPYRTTDADLNDMFSGAGSVVSATIIMDKFSGRSKGFGFVEMSSLDEAEKAISMFNGRDMDGRALTVTEARPKPEGTGGRSFGGGGRRDDR